MKCLVTGGAGFIGSHIVEALLAKNIEVTVLDNLSECSPDILNTFKDKITFIKGDIRDKDTVQKAMEGIEYVFHQAALKLVPRSFEFPEDYNDVNINGTLTLLKAAQKAKVKKFIYASSSSCYGASETILKTETDISNPVSPYAISKLAAEYYCEVFTKNYCLPTVSLRYFNIFGPRQTLKDGYSSVLPKFIAALLKDKPPTVFGDGLQSRDFTHINNVVSANLLAMNFPDVTGYFNVGVGERHDLLTIIDLLNEFLHKDIKPDFLPPSRGDVKHTLASIDKIKKQLWYTPTMSFKDGLRQTLEWYRKAN